MAKYTGETGYSGGLVRIENETMESGNGPCTFVSGKQSARAAMSIVMPRTRIREPSMDLDTAMAWGAGDGTDTST